MAWDFETDPEYQQKLDWARAFAREEAEVTMPGVLHDIASRDNEVGNQ
jgi:hypothetical protein